MSEKSSQYLKRNSEIPGELFLQTTSKLLRESLAPWKQNINKGVSQDFCTILFQTVAKFVQHQLSKWNIKCSTLTYL